jgi:hypothetical protein
LNEGLIDFIRGFGPATADEIANELVHLARHGADWPRASQAEWTIEINGMVQSGALSRDGDGIIRIAPAQPKLTQGSLF